MRPNPAALDREYLTASMLGLAVERAAANLPQTTSSPIFTISGARIFVVALIGQVSTAVQALANLTKLTAVPTSGTAVDICAASDINGLQVGGKLVPAMTAFATVLSVTQAGPAPYTYGGAIVDVGTINLNCAASATGQVRWTLFYVPVDPGATVAAA